MRVLVATDQWFPEAAGGSARVAAETSRRLARSGHEVTVLAPRAEGQPAQIRDGLLTLHRTLARTPIPQTLTDPVETRRHARALAGSFDIVLAHQVTTAVGLRGAHPKTPLALVYHASALRELRFLRSRLPSFPRRFVAYARELPLLVAERAAVRRAAAILVLSDFSRSLVAADHAEHRGRVVRVRGGVDADFFTPCDGAERARRPEGAPPGRRLLVTARRLEPRMGLEQLLHAVAALRSSHDVALALVGAGMLERRLRGLASTLGVMDRVAFLGRAADDELRDWYRAADLFVLPTLAYEGFGMVTVEALACGTPVVGTPVGATPELLRPLDPRLVARDVSPEAIAEAIGAALTWVDDDVRTRCREYAVREFAWTTVMEGWENALAAAAARPRPPTQVG
jgi:glycosyltransferase involved in cell wall biosynthesis